MKLVVWGDIYGGYTPHDEPLKSRLRNIPAGRSMLIPFEEWEMKQVKHAACRLNNKTNMHYGVYKRPELECTEVRRYR